MKVITIWIKSMAMEFTNGQMVGSMKDIGNMGSSMEKVNTHQSKGK